MKVETHIPQDDLGKVAAAVRRAEALGFDSVVTAETSHNPFLALTLAAEHSDKLELSTAIAQSFVRSPTTMAYIAFDLQRLSKGRLYLGMGSQVKGQIERRFGMPWSAPAPRMRDYVGAMRAVWDCWQTGKPLSYEGTHYRLSVMTPNHRPQPLPEGVPFPQLAVSAVQKYTCRLAGECFDGVRLHGFATEDYIKAKVLPELEHGLKKSGRGWDALDISGGGFIATGPNEDEVRKAMDRVRGQIGFYGSTRSYHGVWEMHGWLETGLKLHELSVTNGWAQMPALITDEMVYKFAAVGTYEEIGDRILERFGSFSTRVGLPMPAPEHEELLLPSIRKLQAATKSGLQQSGLAAVQ